MVNLPDNRDVRLRANEMAEEGCSVKSKSFLSLAVFTLTILFLFPPPSPGEGIGEHVHEKVLQNGLKVILIENHRAPLVSFQVWYRVGSRNEEWGETGLSHMLEHMMFKGTHKVSPEEFSRIIQEHGGNDNAFTSSDYTAYFENLSADNVHISIELESDRMQNLLLRERDFGTERMVVMEERRLRTDDDPQEYLAEQMKATAYQIHPYHWPIIGWMEDIRRFTIEELKAYYKTYYNPVNAFVVVAGDIKREELFPAIEKAFGPIPKGEAPDQDKDSEEPQKGERRIIVKREAQLPFIVIGYHIPNLRSPDGYVLEVIESILSGGKSSRLHKKLVYEKELVLSVDAENSILSRDPGLFYFSVAPLPGRSVAEVEKALDEEIGLLQKEEVSEKELEKARNQLEASFVYGQDSLFYQAMLVARYEIVSDWRAIDNYLPSIRRVTPQDIVRVARQYLIPDNRTVGILEPLPSEKGRPAPQGSSIPERVVR
jgi:zinc protease